MFLPRLANSTVMRNFATHRAARSATSLQPRTATCTRQPKSRPSTKRSSGGGKMGKAATRRPKCLTTWRSSRGRGTLDVFRSMGTLAPLDELALLWTEADGVQRQSITEAALRSSRSCGQIRNRRVNQEPTAPILFVPPLGITFNVQPLDRTVRHTAGLAIPATRCWGMTW